MVDKQNFPNSSRRADLLFLAANRERESTSQTDQYTSSHTGLPQRHSRARGNPPHHPSFPRRRKSNPVIRHSRARGNSSSIPQHPKKHSVIPAHAEIHPHHPSFPRKRKSTPTIRHSREGGNPQFPRTREFIVHTPTPEKILRHSRLRGNDG